jgi:uncharacterized membrane protein YqjE
MPADGELDELPISELAVRTIEDARELVKIELALAKQDLREELKAITRAGIELGVAAGCALIAITMFVVTITLALDGAGLALGFAIVFLVAAAITGALGIAAFPKKHLLEPTRDRIANGVDRIKEHVT